MSIFRHLFAICCLAAAAKATPGYYQHGSQRLEGVPDLESFNIIRYPKYELLELGEYAKGHLPADEIHESKHVTVKVPEPYPVQVPVPHPYPVPVPKPYPVFQTKYVKVPHAVPYEIVKKVPVPVEVPKPYPVPVESGHGQSSGWDSYQAGSGNVEEHVEAQHGNDAGNLGGGDLSSYESQGHSADQSGSQDWQGEH